MGNAASSQYFFYLLVEVCEWVVTVRAFKETGYLEGHDTHLTPTVKYLRGQAGYCLSVWKHCVPSS